MTRVLIVDDQPVFCRHLRQLLISAGLTVVGIANDIPQAERLVEKLQPDLAVVDVMLPGINGLEGTRRLKALAPALRVVLISAFVDRAAMLREAAVGVGAEGFVSKEDISLAVARSWIQNDPRAPAAHREGQES